MEKFQELRGEARHRLKNADHLITMTYQMVKDNKLLLAAVENLYQALELSITSVLSYERMFKRIPPFHDELPSKLNIFSQNIAPKYNIDMSETVRGARLGASTQGKLTVSEHAQKHAPGCSPEVFDKSYLKLIQDIGDIVKAHKLSPVEFTRSDKLVIASESYELRQLTPGLVKSYVEKSKKFVQDMEIIVSQDEHIPGRRN